MIFDFSSFIIDHTKNNDFLGNCNARMAACLVQDGRCFVTGVELKPFHRELHHRLPRQYDGGESPANLVYLDKFVHRLVHATHPDEIAWRLNKLNPSNEELHRINQLRLEAKRLAIDRRWREQRADMHLSGGPKSCNPQYGWEGHSDAFIQFVPAEAVS